MSVSALDIVHSGAELLSEDGENVEYDRAITEIVTELVGLSHDHDGEIGAMLRRGRRTWDNHPERPYCDRCGEHRVSWSFTEVGVCDLCLEDELGERREQV